MSSPLEDGKGGGGPPQVLQDGVRWMSFDVVLGGLFERLTLLCVFVVFEWPWRALFSLGATWVAVGSAL